MSDTLGMATQLAGNAVRFGWYSGLNWLLTREAQRLGPRPRYLPQRPVPSQAELMADLRALFLADAAAVRDGLYPPEEPAQSLAEHLRDVRAMFADLPAILERRKTEDTPQRDPARARRRSARLLRAGFPFPDRRLSERGVRLGFTTCRSRRCSTVPPAPCAAPASGPSPPSCTGAISAPARLSTSPAAPGASCARCGWPIPGWRLPASTCRRPISTRRGVISTACGQRRCCAPTPRRSRCPTPARTSSPRCSCFTSCRARCAAASPPRSRACSSPAVSSCSSTACRWATGRAGTAFSKLSPCASTSPIMRTTPTTTSIALFAEAGLAPQDDQPGVPLQGHGAAQSVRRRRLSL